MDYVLPDWFAKALRKPSERTQMESSIVGLLVMMLGSLFIASYFIINGDMTIWFKIAIGASELGILSFQWSILSTTYQTYYQYKLEMGAYPIDYKLKLKLDDAKKISENLTQIIKEFEEENKNRLKTKEEIKNE